MQVNSYKKNNEKRESRNYDKNALRTYDGMRQAVIHSDLELIESDKETGMVHAQTKSRFIFFGGQKLLLNTRKIDDNNTQVLISADKNVSQRVLKEVAEKIFEGIDRELPIGKA